MLPGGDARAGPGEHALLGRAGTAIAARTRAGRAGRGGLAVLQPPARFSPFCFLLCPERSLPTTRFPHRGLARSLWVAGAVREARSDVEEQPGARRDALTRSPCASAPHRPQTHHGPPGGVRCSEEGLEMSNGEPSDRGALEALLFQRVGVRDPLRHERLRSSVPKVTARRRRGPGGVWLHGEVIPGTPGTGIPAPPFPPSQ